MQVKIKERLDGFLLALQFFTIVPVNKQLPLDERRIKKTIQSVPFIGIGIGLFLIVLLLLNELILQLPTTILALLVLTVPIVVTGGIHLDGWMDACDAFFSYRDQQKRLEIMDDPRTGSFAVLAVLFLLLWRYVFIFETLKHASMATLIIVCIYYFARLAMCYVFVFGKLAKQKGLAAFFKQGLERKDMSFHAIGALILLCIFAFVELRMAFIAIILLLVATGFALISRSFIEKQFGGITGDTLGATVEGGETILWLTLWLLHSYAMGLL